MKSVQVSIYSVVTFFGSGASKFISPPVLCFCYLHDISQVSFTVFDMKNVQNSSSYCSLNYSVYAAKTIWSLNERSSLDIRKLDVIYMHSQRKVVAQQLRCSACRLKGCHFSGSNP